MWFSKYFNSPAITEADSKIYIVGKMNDGTLTYFHPNEGRFIAGVECVCSESDFDRATNIAAVDYPLLDIYKKPVNE